MACEHNFTYLGHRRHLLPKVFSSAGKYTNNSHIKVFLCTECGTIKEEHWENGKQEPHYIKLYEHGQYLKDNEQEIVV